jgi:ABC-2 type transport system permease protein
MSASSAVYGIVARDLLRSTRQTSRLLGGIARPFMWLVLVGTGFGAITRLESGLTYPAFVFPGIVTMAALFGGTLTAISTVYDREFGMLRLMLASPAGIPAVLAGRAIAATLVGLLQGGIVLAFAPVVLHLEPWAWLAAVAGLAAVTAMSATLGLLIAARLRSVENFAGIINVVLFPLLFLSGALYPTTGRPPLLLALARANPVTYAVDLLRHALGQPAERVVTADIAVVIGTAVAAFAVTAVLFDPEQRLIGRARGDATPAAPPRR